MSHYHNRGRELRTSGIIRSWSPHRRFQAITLNRQGRWPGAKCGQAPACLGQSWPEQRWRWCAYGAGNDKSV